MSIGSLVGIALSSYLPGADPAVRAMAGGVLGGVIEKGMSKVNNVSTTWMSRLWQKNYAISISRSDDEIIYNKLERYIVQRHIEKVHACTLKPVDGEIMIGLGGADIRGSISEQWDGHSVSFEISTKETKLTKEVSVSNSIIVRSNTAKVEELQRYVESICQYRESSRCLRIHRAVVETSGKKDKERTDAYWSVVNTLTNKRIDNTILSDLAEKELYKDVKWFLNNQPLYDTQGIPYKRGYFLHGVPGTGKTSCIKAIANEYHLDVFSVQMNDLTNNSQFTLLMTRITELTSNRPYILALEDFDRSSLFDKWEDSSKISLGSILNELDGVTETFGRLLFITANTRERFNNRNGIDALFRPGRIDKEIQLGHVDKKQLERMVAHFANIELEIPVEAIPKQLTPAKVISVLQQYIGRDRQEDLQEDIKGWQFWTELQKEPSTGTITLTSDSRKIFGCLEKRIKRKRQVITRHSKAIRRTELGLARMPKTRERLAKEMGILKALRAQLSAKRHKERQVAKLAAKKRTQPVAKKVAVTKRRGSQKNDLVI